MQTQNSQIKSFNAPELFMGNALFDNRENEAGKAFDEYKFLGGIVTETSNWVVVGDVWTIISYMDNESGYKFKTKLVVKFRSDDNIIMSVKQVDFFR
jgi:hypothetical protein